MQTTKIQIVVFIVLCCIYRSEGLLDGDNTLRKAIKQLNLTFQQTAAELQNTISTMNSTIQKSAIDLQNDRNVILAMNTTVQKSGAELHEAKNTILKLNTTIHESDMKMSALQQEVQRLGQGTSPPIIFYAYLSTPKYVGPEQTVVFDRVVTNVGNAYDPRDGCFTAPVDGYYHFSATITSVPNDGLSIKIVKNGVSIAALFAEYNHYQTGSGSINIELATNDMVWLKHIDTSLHKFDGIYCFFSGFILRRKM